MERTNVIRKYTIYWISFSEYEEGSGGMYVGIVGKHIAVPNIQYQYEHIF